MTVRQRRKKGAFFQQVQRLNCGRRRQLDEDERFDKALEYDEDYDWEAYGAIVGRASSSASSSNSSSVEEGATQHGRVRHSSSRLIEGFETKLLRSFRRRSSSAAASRATNNNNNNTPSHLQLHVKVPLGLEPGNTLLVVLPHDHDLPALKVPVKVPAGLKAGDEFVVPDTCITAALNQDDDEGSLSSLVESIVEHPPCILPGLENDSPKQQKHFTSSWASTPAETRQDSVVDLSVVLDDFFTPTPEVQGYYRRSVY